MISKLEGFFRWVRSGFSRSLWLIRLLNLSIDKGSSTRPGLVMIQVDGLSRNHFERALENNEMPFLKRLIKHDHYHMHTLYSGLPSSTPAVQAELFYGVKTVVPAFSFLDRESGEVVRMYEPAAAAKIEDELIEKCSLPLLAGGSAYSDNFTGGAKEAHFCASSMGWGEALRAANPFTLVLLLGANINSVVRVFVLIIAELVLSIIDFFRGVASGLDIRKELKFIPTRVVICVLLRELCVIGGKMDIRRGFPIIHINFLGYDEQSHRRGPDSLFAHWTLKGIDDSILRLWREANRASWRHYEVWIYSDHGQVKSVPYLRQQGYSIEHAIHSVADASGNAFIPIDKHRESSVETHRVKLLGGKNVQRLLAEFSHRTESRTSELTFEFVGLGPVGLVYFKDKKSRDELNYLAQKLTENHNVPAVISGMGDHQLVAFTNSGQYKLPQQIEDLFGADHPFINLIGEDLENLCRHSHGGDLTLLGWRKGALAVTFATENGSHAGATHEETRAFGLLPKDAPLAENRNGFYRPTELREAALRYLGRLKSRPAAEKVLQNGAATSPGRLRVMTYNVHSCKGIDGKLSCKRIAKVIARANPDVVALQELDMGHSRSGGEDQAKLIARYLSMDYHFHPAINLEEEKYGDAILTRLPLHKIKTGILPGRKIGSRREPRGALWVTVELDGIKVNIINTHLGLSPTERMQQIDALLGNEWTAHSNCQEPVIFCGDFNAVPSSGVCKKIRNHFNDAQQQIPGHRPRNTFYSRVPTARIDHIFISNNVTVNAIEVPRSRLAIEASDHLPLIADLEIMTTGVKDTSPQVQDTA